MIGKLRTTGCVFAVILAAGVQLWGQETVPAPGPKKGGLASLYPGDEGMEKDPRVIFADDFETGTVSETGERWGQIAKAENFAVSEDVPANSPGVRSMSISKTGHLFTHTRPVDVMYARFYVKFHPNTGFTGHLVGLQADRQPTSWSKGDAGKKPAGDYRFFSHIEPTGGNEGQGFKPPGIWQFYSYWHQMKADGRGNYWGNVVFGKKEQIEPGRWYCMEAMLKANSAPDKSDGEQAFWVDGELKGKFEGFNWRTTNDLKINTLWLLYYNDLEGSENSRRRDPDFDKRVMQIGFDDIVVATEYIGPVVGKPKAGKKVGVPSRSALEIPGLLIADPGKVIYQQKFEAGAAKFTGGEVVDGGVDGSKAYSFGGKNGCSIWGAFATKVTDSTTIRFKVKPLFANTQDLTVMIKSDVLNDNCRFIIRGTRVKQGEWYNVEFKGLEVRQGWAASGKSLDGSNLNNFKLIFTGGENDRMLIDDFEVCE